MRDTKSDVFTQLSHAVLDARHNGTPRETVEAARRTLMGQLPPLPPCVAAMIRTDFVEVPMCAISQEGRIAFVGIQIDGSKEVVLWDRQTGARETILDMQPKASSERFDFLHFPEGSEEPVFVERLHPDKKSGDGLNTSRCVYIMHWGQWSFEINPDATGSLVSVSCFKREGEKMCLATIRIKSRMSLVMFHQAWDGRTVEHTKKIEFIGFIDSALLCVMDDYFVIMERVEYQCRIRLCDFEGNEVWKSGLYDRIVASSVMVRDQELSFVGLRKEGQDSDWVAADAYLVNKNGETLIAEHVMPENIRCLPSGQILIAEYGEQYLTIRGYFLNPFSNNKVNLPLVWKIKDVVEIGSDFAILVSDQNAKESIHFIDRRTDVVWGLMDRYITVSGATNLRRMGDWLVWQNKDNVHFVDVGTLELWLDGASEVLDIATGPLYTSSDRLVPTQGGIMSWHFVNGTFYIICY